MSKKQYRIRNWNNYNKALVERGSINLWFDEESIKEWHKGVLTGEKGRPREYSDIAIQCGLTIKAIFKLTLRSTEGFIKSIISMLALKIKSPNYTTLCRRQKNLEIKLPKTTNKKPIHLIVDSTGLKVYGEGEWKVRQHGYSKRRTWRKLHLGINADTNEIESMAFSTNDFKDSELLPDIIDGVNGTIKQVSADGAYDSHDIYKLINDMDARPVIPPRKDAVITQHKNFKKCPLPRDEVLRDIRKYGRKAWKITSGYHKRSLSETAMFRVKTIFGCSMRARNFDNQAVEAFILCAALNKITRLGMPDSFEI